jgi:hypothetical protein
MKWAANILNVFVLIGVIHLLSKHGARAVMKPLYSNCS